MIRTHNHNQTKYVNVRTSTLKLIITVIAMFFHALMFPWKSKIRVMLQHLPDEVAFTNSSAGRRKKKGIPLYYEETHQRPVKDKAC